MHAYFFRFYIMANLLNRAATKMVSFYATILLRDKASHMGP